MTIAVTATNPRTVDRIVFTASLLRCRQAINDVSRDVTRFRTTAVPITDNQNECARQAEYLFKLYDGIITMQLALGNSFRNNPMILPPDLRSEINVVMEELRITARNANFARRYANSMSDVNYRNDLLSYAMPLPRV